MTVCPSCASELPEGSRFCLSCGVRLASPPSAAEERKVVTTLFCDLVGFTSMAERTDPEDVDAVLRRYYAAAREVIESHGGTVEKFVGDAVVGVFGVPAAHEDDPERAVTAGLRLVTSLGAIERPDGSPLEVRVGINTGETLVRLDIDPLSGRGFLVGDAVNSAARLQAAASPGQVVVGGLTYELASRAIVYEELPRVVAKGKVEALTAWLACGPTAESLVGVDPGGLSPLVGRDEHVARLAALFERAVR
jgi:class 3 adenylate cyclase